MDEEMGDDAGSRTGRQGKESRRGLGRWIMGENEAGGPGKRGGVDGGDQGMGWKSYFRQ